MNQIINSSSPAFVRGVYRERGVRLGGTNGRVRVAIACQGGGSHTAFTAGALKRLLADERYEVVASSGTSGRAICAVLAWYALLENGGAAGRILEGQLRERAFRRVLERVAR